MANPKRGHCSNRDIVNAQKRLYSPRYDFEGDDGLAWYELIDADAMCFWGMCDHDSYNAWVKATDRYINDTLVPHYKKVLSRAEAVHGGAAFPVELTDRFNKVEDAVNSWQSAGYRADKGWSDDFRHPFATWWWGEIRKIIDYFDEAACQFDQLDDIAAHALKQPSLAKGAPIRQLEHVEGGYLGGHGGPSGKAKGERSVLGMAVGVVAIGAAGYFGYKVLTE